MTPRVLAAVAAAAVLVVGCSGASEQAGTVSTDAPLQQLDVQTVPPQTVPTTSPPTNPVVVSTTDPAGGSGGSTDGESGGETTEPGQGCTYTVVAGDTPIKISRKTGVTLDAFIAANEASGVLNSLLIGSKVVIPPPGSC